MVYEWGLTRPRRPVAASYTGPGPCHALPCLIGYNNHDPRSSYTRGPAYQFGIEHYNLPGSCSPGPCHHIDPKICRTGKDGSPSYSIYSRPKVLEAFSTPGPGTYPYQNVKPVTKPLAPAYTFGSTCSLKPRDDVPGPNTYSIPNSLGKTVESGKIRAPSYSIYGRSKTGNFYDDTRKAPAPGSYKVTAVDLYKGKSPQYSLTGKNPMPGDATLKPGPGAHSPEKVTMHKTNRPRFSFGIRHSDYVAPLLLDPCAD